jgi:hypothetical protein
MPLRLDLCLPRRAPRFSRHFWAGVVAVPPSPHPTAREARRRALLRAQNGHCLGMDRRDDRVRCRCQKVVDLMRPWDRLVPRSPLRRCESAIISNERRIFRLPSASRCDRHRPKVPRADYPKFLCLRLPLPGRSGRSLVHRGRPWAKTGLPRSPKPAADFC